MSQSETENSRSNDTATTTTCMRIFFFETHPPACCFAQQHDCSEKKIGQIWLTVHVVRANELKTNLRSRPSMLSCTQHTNVLIELEIKLVENCYYFCFDGFERQPHLLRDHTYTWDGRVVNVRLAGAKITHRKSINRMAKSSNTCNVVILQCQNLIADF